MKRLFATVSQALQNLKNISFTEGNNNPEPVKTLKLSVLISPEDKITLDQRNANLKSIFNKLKEHEVKLDPWSVGDIYRYHMLRQDVASSYKVPPKLSEATNAILYDNTESEVQPQLVGENYTLDVNIPVKE